MKQTLKCRFPGNPGTCSGQPVSHLDEFSKFEERMHKCMNLHSKFKARGPNCCQGSQPNWQFHVTQKVPAENFMNAPACAPTSPGAGLCVWCSMTSQKQDVVKHSGKTYLHISAVKNLTTYTYSQCACLKGIRFTQCRQRQN